MSDQTGQEPRSQLPMPRPKPALTPWLSGSTARRGDPIIRVSSRLPSLGTEDTDDHEPADRADELRQLAGGRRTAPTHDAAALEWREHLDPQLRRSLR
jgi:hypothetical protein